MRLLTSATAATAMAASIGFTHAQPAIGAAGPAVIATVTQQRTQVPSYRHMVLDDDVVITLYDGYTDLPAKTLLGLSARSVQSLLVRMFVSNTPDMQMAVNGFLIDMGDKYVPVDTDSGTCFGPTTGGLAGNVRAPGYQLERTGAVLLTHLHSDHAYGLLTPQGRPAFVDTQVYTAAPGANFRLNETITAPKSSGMQPFFKIARDSVAPYAAADKLKQLKPGDEIVQGVRLVVADGHTPGHSSYLLVSKGRSLLVWGDIVHSRAVQFQHPKITFEYDVDKETTVATRRKLLAEVARDKLWVADAHLPLPGLGHIRHDDSAFVWVPIEYGPLRTSRAD